MKMFLPNRAVIGACLLLGSACSTPDRTASVPRNRYGLQLSDATNRALKFVPGMPQDSVKELLGDPDETSAGTYGTSTAHPWQGVAWMYKWHWGEFGLYGRSLVVIFEKGGTNWFVNSWNWYNN